MADTRISERQVSKKKLDRYFLSTDERKMERVRRFERPTSTLARLRSTPELHPLIVMLEIKHRVGPVVCRKS